MSLCLKSCQLFQINIIILVLQWYENLENEPIALTEFTNKNGSRYGAEYTLE